MDYLPLFHKLDGRPVLIVGGGEVALRKVHLVHEAGALITLVAKDFCSELLAMAGEDRDRPLELICDSYQEHYLDNFSDEIKNDKELVIIADSPDNGGAPAYRYASDELQKDPDVIAATKKGNLADGWDEDQGIYL